MALSDRDIKIALVYNWVVVTPLKWRDIQPASIDVYLDPFLGIPRKDLARLDPRESRDWVDHYEEIGEDGYHLKPGEFLWGQTVEWVRIPNWLLARIEGRSSLGRMGLSVHITAGFVDPGFRGNLTMEIKNHAPWEITLYKRMGIGQISFDELLTPAEIPYGHPSRNSKYQDQVVPTASRMYQEF